MEKLLKLLKNNKYLIFILFLALTVRLYGLGKNPASLNRDETAIGYNAYSILKTGKDEWGNRLPLNFKSFGDYKAPLYIYITVPSIAIFSLNEFAVRFPSALAGALTVLAVYFLVKKQFVLGSKSDDPGAGAAVIVSFLLAISPWHIHFSRYAFEANLALFLNVCILYRLQKNKFEKINFLDLNLIIASIAAYSSSFIILPIFLAGLAIYKLINKKPKVFIKFILVILVISPLVFFQLKTVSAKSKVTIFSNPQIRLDFNKQRVLMFEKSPLKAKIFYNQYLYYGTIFAKNYIAAFNPDFLFGKGGNHPWHKIASVGHFYKTTLLLVLSAFYLFKKSKTEIKFKKILLFWFSLSLVPSAVTVDAPHATRLLNFFVIINIVAGLGLFLLLKFNKKIKLIGLITLAALLISFIRYLYFYHFIFVNDPPKETLPGIKQAIVKLKGIESQADLVVFDNPSKCSYIYLLFFKKYPPDRFFNNSKHYKPDTAGLEYVEFFDNYLFVKSPKPNFTRREIYITQGEKMPPSAGIYEEIRDKKGQVLFTIAKNF